MGRGLEMRYIGAELDVDAIDKVDVLDELRRFLMFPASEPVCQIWDPYSNLSISSK